MPLWIPIAFTAVILWVIGNLIDKYLIESFRHDDDQDTDANTLFMFSSLFALPTGIFALIMGANFHFSLSQALIGIVVGVLNGTYLLLYLHALAKTEISRIAPVFQSIPIFTALFGFFFLRETLTSTQITAGLLVVSGAMILSYHKSSGKFKPLPTLLILAASVCVALQLTLFKVTALATTYWTGALLSSIGLFLFGLAVYVANKRSRKHLNHIFRTRQYRFIGINFANEVLDTLALFTFMFATLLGPLALVQTVHAYHPVITFMVTAIVAKLGYDVFGEEITRDVLLQKTLGIVLIGVGSAFIYIPLILWH